PPLPLPPAPATRGRVDVRTDGAAARRPAVPGAQALPDAAAHLDEVLQLAVELHGLRAQQALDVPARRAAAPADRDDLLDLGQGEPEAARLGDEAQHVDRVLAVDPIAIGGACGRLQDLLSFVEADRLRRDAGLPGQLADLESAFHMSPRLKLSP